MFGGSSTRVVKDLDIFSPYFVSSVRFSGSKGLKSSQRLISSQNVYLCNKPRFLSGFFSKKFYEDLATSLLLRILQVNGLLAQESKFHQKI